jgi:putative spermidine/putrescine transport system ATP-binding protein
MAQTFLTLEKLTKKFGEVEVVKGFDMAVEQGEFISFLGPSGCGKTTVLRMIAGFERPTSGRIMVKDSDLTALPPSQRRIGMVFQAYALFPNMNVADNIAFGLRVAGNPRAEMARRVEEMLELIGLEGLHKRFPFELSGGQQQRVALARALAPRPRILLLDEPLSALDAKIRVSLRNQIRQIQRELGITTIFVTHDQEEALSISDRIVVMNAGIAEQIGTPFQVYNSPATGFVAGFVGSLNTFEAQVDDPTAGMVRLGGNTIRLSELPPGAAKGEKLTLAVRPEAVSLVNGHAPEIVLDGHVAEVHFLGSIIRLRIAVGETSVSVDTFNDKSAPPPAHGEPVRIGFTANDVILPLG